MHAAGGEIGEKRLFRIQRFRALDPVDGAVGKVGGEMVVFVIRWAVDERIILDEMRIILMRLATDEAVEIIEAHGVRPMVERTLRARFDIRRVVPFAEHRGVIAVQAQHLGDAGGGFRPPAIIAGIAGGKIGNNAEPHGMMVAPGEQGGARGRAQAGIMKAVIEQPVAADAVEGRSVYVAAEGAGMA